MHDIKNSGTVSNQKEFVTISHCDYIKKLVLYICSVMPIYKGTQEVVLNGDLLDLFDVIIDYFYLN